MITFSCHLPPTLPKLNSVILKFCDLRSMGNPWWNQIKSFSWFQDRFKPWIHLAVLGLPKGWYLMFFPKVLNHRLMSLSDLWMDATQSLVPQGFLVSSLQNKPSLPLPSSSSVPVNLCRLSPVLSGSLPSWMRCPEPAGYF